MKESTKKSIEKAPAIATPVVPAPAPTDVNLSIQDLTTALQIISVVTSRGAVKAEEMAVVGNLYNKLKSFLEAAAIAAEQAEAALPEAEDTTVEPAATPKEPAIGDAEK